jgi:putative ABC transport system permease protein
MIRLERARLRSGALMRPYALLYLYGARLRVNATQEVLAAIGVATAVALLFATLIAAGSVASSSEQVVHAVVGPANLQVRARDGDGFDEGLLRRVKALSGVRQAAPLLEQTASIEGADARQVTVDVAGTTPSLAILNGLAHTLPLSTLSPGGIGLSDTAAASLGIGNGPGHMQTVSVRMRGVRTSLKVSAVLGTETFGALARARVAVVPLSQLQRLTGLSGRISRILVQTRAGQAGAVRSQLRRLAAGRLIVASATQDEQVLRQTLGPSQQASALFAAISGLLGFLFAFNAMLLTVPERRQVIASLRVDGARRTAIVQMVIFQALCLGIVASIFGVFGGYLLSVGLFHQSPGYLAQAFTLGTSTVVSAKPVAVAIGGGVLATLLASLLPLLDLRRGRALNAIYQDDGAPGNVLGRDAQRWLFGLALALFMLASLLFWLVPSAAIASCLLLALATVLSVPLVLAGALCLAEALADRHERLTILPVALGSMRATSLRSLALAGTGALALFGSVALGGSRNDLLRGIARYTSHYVAGADIWLVNPGDNQAIDDFTPDHYRARVQQVDGVAQVHAFQGSFLNLGDRRVWVIAWPSSVSPALLADQIVNGQLGRAARRIEQGGWITVSQQLASDRGVRVGGTLRIATPRGERPFKVAATTTNFGWIPGAILMNTADYGRAWQTTAPSALGVDVTPGADIGRVRSEIERRLGPASGLEVLTADKRARSIDSSASEGLGQLGDIATLLLIAAILAMVAALGSSIWQRRVSLAALRLEGTTSARLRRLLLIEIVLMLSAGAVTGALAGVYGEVISDHYLRGVTGFPVAGIVAGRRPLEIFVLVVASVLAVATIPGWFASRVPATLALEE